MTIKLTTEYRPDGVVAIDVVDHTGRHAFEAIAIFDQDEDAYVVLDNGDLDFDDDGAVRRFDGLDDASRRAYALCEGYAVELWRAEYDKAGDNLRPDTPAADNQPQWLRDARDRVIHDLEEAQATVVDALESIRSKLTFIRGLENLDCLQVDKVRESCDDRVRTLGRDRKALARAADEYRTQSELVHKLMEGAPE